MHIFLHWLIIYRPRKQDFPFLGIAFKVPQLSIPLSGSFRNQDLEDITKNTVSFLPMKIGIINSGHCRPNKEKRVLTLFCRLDIYIRDGCCLPRWLRRDNRCVLPMLLPPGLLLAKTVQTWIPISLSWLAHQQLSRICTMYILGAGNQLLCISVSHFFPPF